MNWPLNYPGDEYLTNVFSQVIIMCEDIKDTAIDFIDNIMTPISEKVIEHE